MSHLTPRAQQIAGQRQATDPSRFAAQGLMRFATPAVERGVAETERANLIRGQQLIPLSIAQKEVFRPLILRGLILNRDQRKGQGLSVKTNEQIDQGVESILSRATQGDAVLWDQAFARLQGQQRNIIAERQIAARGQPRPEEPEDTFNLLNQAEDQIIQRRKAAGTKAVSDPALRAEAIIDVTEKLGPQRAARVFTAFTVVNFMLGQLSPGKAADQVREWSASREDLAFLNNFGGPRVETYLQGLSDMIRDDRPLWQRTLGFFTTTPAEVLNIARTTAGAPEAAAPAAPPPVESVAGIRGRPGRPSARIDLGPRR